MRMTMESARAVLDRLAIVVAGPAAQASRSWQRLRRDAAANVTLVFGFCAIGVVGSVGIAIDTSVAYNVRSQLASAVDAAALAGARAFASPNRDTDIENFFNANFSAGYMGSTLQPLEIAANDQERTVTVTARANIPTYFMRLFGKDSTDIAATAEATLSSRDVEVALVLDVTGSMDIDDRIGDLKDAANELIEIVVQDIQVPFRSRVSIVPYSVAVNVGSYANQIRGTYSAGTTCEYPAAPTCEVYRFRRADNNNWTQHNISTCVTERSGPQAYTDAAPNMAAMPPHFPPAGTYNPCPSAAIMPLSDDKVALHTAINALATGGSTAGQIGIAWGWYMLAPNFSYLWSIDNQPMGYNEINLGQQVMKVVIIMTDGEFNSVHHSGVLAKDSTSGSGTGDRKINQNSHNGNPFTQSQSLCTAMKAEGVIVYTVGLALTGLPNVTSLMNGCATSPQHVFLPNNGTELKDAFRDIAVQVSNLRISM